VTDAIAGWQWVITDLHNGTYTIKNVAYEKYASTMLGNTSIVATDDKGYWKIHKTHKIGEYLYVHTFDQCVLAVCSTCLLRFFLLGQHHLY
jgi:hypothetical protein